MISSRKIKVSEFFSVCVQLINESGKIAKHIIDLSSYNTRTKGVNKELFTDADVQIQALVTQGLKYVWPEIRIIGEEDEIYEGRFDFKFETLRKDLYNHSRLFGEDFMGKELEMEKSTVWIDPIDGTRDFVNGNFNGVTTLIGLSYESKATLGLIGKYYYPSDKELEFKLAPKCYFSWSIHPEIFRVELTQDLDQFERIIPAVQEEIPKDLRITVSRPDREGKSNSLVRKLEPQQVEYGGGCGNRIVSVIEDRSDLYCYLGTSTSRWDACAGNALFKSFGGYFTNCKGEELVYPNEKIEVKNMEGLLVCKSKGLYNEVISHIKKA